MEIIYNCSNGGGENIVSNSSSSCCSCSIGVLSRCWVDTILDLQRCVLRQFFLLSSHCPLFLPFLCALFSSCVLSPCHSRVLFSSQTNLSFSPSSSVLYCSPFPTFCSCVFFYFYFLCVHFLFFYFLFSRIFCTVRSLPFSL